ncbi:portal protein [Shigella flexneri]
MPSRDGEIYTSIASEIYDDNAGTVVTTAEDGNPESNVELMSQAVASRRGFRLSLKTTSTASMKLTLMPPVLPVQEEAAPR